MHLMFWLEHGLSGIAPALCMASFMALLDVRAQRRWRAWPGAMCMYTAAGIGVLLVGLGWWGVDGKMLTYGALVLVMGTLAAWRTRA